MNRNADILLYRLQDGYMPVPDSGEVPENEYGQQATEGQAAVARPHKPVPVRVAVQRVASLDAHADSLSPANRALQERSSVSAFAPSNASQPQPILAEAAPASGSQITTGSDPTPASRAPHVICLGPIFQPMLSALQPRPPVNPNPSVGVIPQLHAVPPRPPQPARPPTAAQLRWHQMLQAAEAIGYCQGLRQQAAQAQGSKSTRLSFHTQRCEPSLEPPVANTLASKVLTQLTNPEHGPSASLMPPPQTLGRGRKLLAMDLSNEEPPFNALPTELSPLANAKQASKGLDRQAGKQQGKAALAQASSTQAGNQQQQASAVPSASSQQRQAASAVPSAGRQQRQAAAAVPAPSSQQQQAASAVPSASSQQRQGASAVPSASSQQQQAAADQLGSSRRQRVVHIAEQQHGAVSPPPQGMIRFKCNIADILDAHSSRLNSSSSQTLSLPSVPSTSSSNEQLRTAGSIPNRSPSISATQMSVNAQSSGMDAQSQEEARRAMPPPPRATAQSVMNRVAAAQGTKWALAAHAASLQAAVTKPFTSATPELQNPALPTGSGAGQANLNLRPQPGPFGGLFYNALSGSAPSQQCGPAQQSPSAGQSQQDPSAGPLQQGPSVGPFQQNPSGNLFQPQQLFQQGFPGMPLPYGGPFGLPQHAGYMLSSFPQVLMHQLAAEPSMDLMRLWVALHQPMMAQANPSPLSVPAASEAAALNLQADARPSKRACHGEALSFCKWRMYVLSMYLDVDICGIGMHVDEAT